MSKLFVITDPPLDGPTNMAIDEALLETVAAGTLPAVLRFYQWTPATLSLGYFQGYRLREEHSASLYSPIVRRASGGGAIMHDHELTYSLVLNREHRLAKNAETLYNAVHEALVDLLAADYKITARFWRDVRSKVLQRSEAETQSPPNIAGTELKSTLRPREPFLCFERRTDGDIVVQQLSASPAGQSIEASEKNATPLKKSPPGFWFKILGSAQRRHAGAVLQHGSLLLRSSNFAPELPGLQELIYQRLMAEKVAASWLPRIAALVDLPTESADSSLVLHGNEFKKSLEKFAGSDWLMMRK